MARSRVPPHHLAWAALLSAHAAASAAMSRALAAADAVSFETYDVLYTLSHAPGGRLRLGELAAGAFLTKSGLTRAVDRLEEAGLLRRERCPGDARGTFAVLTRKGEAALERAWPVYRAEIDRVVGAVLTAEEAGQLTELLDRVRQRAMPPQPLRPPPRLRPG